MIYLTVYLLIINLIGFIVYRSDKKNSQKGKWRTKETTLLSFSLIGGGIGSILGMRIYRHKTNKMKFSVGVPLLTIVSIIIIWLIFNTFIYT